MASGFRILGFRVWSSGVSRLKEAALEVHGW